MAKVWQFLQGHQKPAFSEKVQTGDQKDALPKNAQKHAGENGMILYSVCNKSANTGQDFGA